jgi:ectoine hydroxylase-related dioxygenase (phytanoyl-CoA dioxygenase family)
MIICKQPEIGGAVPPHQDSTFLYTDPPSAVGFWYALEDATVENGCLSFLPGSHRSAEIGKRFVRRKDGGGTEFVDNEGMGFPAGKEFGGGPVEGEYKFGEVKAGTLVLIHGNLLHKSEKNVSKKGRIIYTFHVIEGAGATYDERNCRCWGRSPFPTLDSFKISSRGRFYGTIANSPVSKGYNRQRKGLQSYEP